MAAKKPKAKKGFVKTGVGGVGTKGKIHLTKRTATMSARHHKENFKFNMKHAQEHLAEANHSARKMTKGGAPTPIRKIVSA